MSQDNGHNKDYAVVSVMKMILRAQTVLAAMNATAFNWIDALAAGTATAEDGGIAGQQMVESFQMLMDDIHLITTLPILMNKEWTEQDVVQAVRKAMEERG